MLSFADGSHCNFSFIYKQIFFGEIFLYTQKAKKINPVYERDLKKAQILSAILSNKNEILHL